MLSGLKAKYAKEDRRFKAENAELTDEFKRLTEQFKELQGKFHHFEQADTRRYRDLWNMHEQEITELMRKVLQADKVIHEQQLGLNWYPPSEQIFQDGAEADQAAIVVAPTDQEEGPLSHAQMDNEQIKRMLELLCDEANFLVEAKVQKLLDPLPLDEQNLLKIDSILKVLGVENAADVEKLLSYFLADADNAELIHPNDAIKAIKAFVEDHQRRADAARGKQHAAKKHAADEQPGPSREEVEFWNRMAGIISDKTARVWTVRARAGRHRRVPARVAPDTERAPARRAAGAGEVAAKVQRAAAVALAQNSGRVGAQHAEQRAQSAAEPIPRREGACRGAPRHSSPRHSCGPGRSSHAGSALAAARVCAG